MSDVPRGRREVVHAGAPALVAALVSAVVLGPALGRGVVLAYDLAWSPDPRLTPFSLGTGTPAPRAVPSDAAGVVLGFVVGAGPAQALVLWGTLVLAGIGAARLAVLMAPDLSLLARSAAVIAAIWNPFVLERLAVGQWTVLLGYAALPHVLISAARVRTGLSPVWAPAVGLAACGVGGANTLVLAVLGAGAVLATPRPRWRALGLAAVAALGASAVWAVPAALAGVGSASAGAVAFAARADTPLGVFGSLLSGGGFWNAATHPGSRQVALVAVVAAALGLASVTVAARAARSQGVGAILVPAVLGLGLAWASSVDPLGLWSTVVRDVAGGGVLRDAQKLVAPWVVVAAAGAGVLVRDLGRVRAIGPALAALATALPVVLLPTLVWGIGGRLTAIEVPGDLRSVAAALSREDRGTVGLLPWSQYRRYSWNGDRVSLTLAPRLIDQRVLFDDSLPLNAGSIPGEDPAARRVGQRIETGTAPLDALAVEGVTWVLVEKSTGLPDPVVGADLPPGARIVSDGPSALLIELQPPGPPAELPSSDAVAIGWAMTCLTWCVATACLITKMVRRRGYLLVRSRA